MARRAVLGAFAVALIASPPPTEDPNWPCQQRLVPELSAADYWSGPLNVQGDWQSDPQIAALVRHLAPRSVTADEGLAAIAAFAASVSGDRSHRIALVFSGLLGETNRERADLIERLKQIGRRQRELAALAADLAGKLDAIPPDATGELGAERTDLQQRHDFTARNFEEVQRTIRYACEAPVSLDARLGTWARALQTATQP